MDLSALFSYYNRNGDTKMRIKNLIGDRFKERPSDCVIDSHALMVRGGYMKYVANGIYFHRQKELQRK